MHEMAIFLPMGSDGRISSSAIERYGVKNWNALGYALNEKNLDKKIRRTRENLENWSKKLSIGNFNQLAREKIYFLNGVNRKRAKKLIAARAEKAVFFHAIRWNLFQLEVARFLDKDRSEDLFQIFRLEWKIEHLWIFTQTHCLVWKKLDILRKSIGDIANRVRSQQKVFVQAAHYGYVRERAQIFVKSPSKKLHVLSYGRNVVYWHPKSRCVLKPTNARLEYEENLVESLSHFYGDMMPFSAKVFYKDQLPTRVRPYFRLDSLMHMKMKKLASSAMKKLGAQGEMAAIFAAEMQFLDLSEGNVHFARSENNDQLLLVLLDSELSLAESNNSLHGVDLCRKKSIFPFRSCLMNLPWAKQPLSQECLDWLYALPDSEGHLWDWVNRKSDTFLVGLPTHLQRAVVEKIAPLLEKYSFSNCFLLKGSWNLAKMRRSFIDDLAKMQNESHREFWSFLQQKLPPCHEKVPIHNFQSLSCLAKKYAVSPTLLQKLHPQYSLNQTLPEGSLFSVPFDLTSSSPLAEQKRRNWAKQLFPRMTILQQKALRERQKRRSSYLKVYRQLQKCTISHPQELLNFVLSSAIPLPTLVRKEWIQKINYLAPEKTDDLDLLRHLFIKLTRPSYYNLCLAMYPLLGDVIRIYQEVYPIGGINLVGSFLHPLEDAIALANKLSYPDIQDLATEIAEKILTKENRVYYYP